MSHQFKAGKTLKIHFQKKELDDTPYLYMRFTSVNGCQVKISTLFTVITNVKNKISDKYEGKMNVLPRLTMKRYDSRKGDVSFIEEELEEYYFNNMHHLNPHKKEYEKDFI